MIAGEFCENKREHLPLLLRPHHGMCFRFYEGKGYSAEFTDHMGRVIRMLTEDPERTVRLTVSADAVCEHCPNNAGGTCGTAEKVRRYDEAVLNACGLKDGDVLSYAGFSALVQTKILEEGLRRSICGDCEWDGVCDAVHTRRNGMRFQTDRLIIRHFTNHDFPDYYAYIMDPELQSMLGLNGVTDEASAKETFDWLIKNRTFLAVEQKETGTVIGHICIHPPYAPVENDPLYRGKNGCSLSFALARGAQRKGYMEEALRGLIARLFSRGRMEYIDCEYTEGNTASKALQEKLGFVLWGKETFDAEKLAIHVLEKEKCI